MPQAIYSSVCQVGQRESKTLQMVKDGYPVCYVLQETPQCEQANFPYFSGIKLREEIPGTGRRQGGLCARYKRQYLSVLGNFA